ncbi:MAG: DMT family transporter, partial [Pseudomonadota bacterium]
EEGQWLWALLPLVTALAYACENVFIAKYLPPGLDAVQTMAGLTLGALFLILPVLAVQGGWVDITRFEGPEQAIVAGSVLHVIAYLGLVWLIGKAGPVFTAQIGYIVTLSGVFLGMIFLGETLASWAWISLLLMTAGLSLVSPKHQIKLSST